MGAQEIILLGAIGFLLFGANKLPELARSFGTSILEFKKALKDGEPAENGTLPVKGAATPGEPVHRA